MIDVLSACASVALSFVRNVSTQMSLIMLIDNCAGEIAAPAELSLSFYYIASPFADGQGLIVEEDWNARSFDFISLLCGVVLVLLIRIACCCCCRCKKVADFYMSLWVTSGDKQQSEQGLVFFLLCCDCFRVIVLGVVVSADEIRNFRAAIGDTESVINLFCLPVRISFAPSQRFSDCSPLMFRTREAN